MTFEEAKKVAWLIGHIPDFTAELTQVANVLFPEFNFLYDDESPYRPSAISSSLDACVYVDVAPKP